MTTRSRTLDKAWVDKNASVADLEKEVSGNALSAYLKTFIQGNPDEVEVFFTDQKGLNVSMTDRTSDFLQADEAWWKSAFNNGSGATYIGQVEFDESSKTYAMNIGVPIRDPQTRKTIGVMRGTMDISVLISVLGDLKIGNTGNAWLINRDGVILYSPDKEQIMKPAPEWITGLFKEGKNGWVMSKDFDEVPALLSYNLMQGDQGKMLDWRLVLGQDQVEVNQGALNSLLMSLLAGLIVAVIAIVISLRLISSITKPIVALTKTTETLATGDFDLTGQDRGYLNKVSQQGDEVGAMFRASFSLLDYMKEMAGAAEKVAGGDLTTQVTARSQKDQLGNSFSRMIDNLQGQVGQVAENAHKLNEASAQMAEAAKQAGTATSQIAITIQQLTSGATQQSDAVNRTAGSIEKMSQMIETVARSSQDQSEAVERASKVTNQISSSIKQVAGNAKAVTEDSTRAANAARAGFQTVEDTVKGMQAIKSKVDYSAHKVQDMGSRSDQIGAIVETIEDIASQTNLLALNAAIEAARAGEHGKGFAVVADEVRKLAERASSATKEIGGLIRGIQQTVSEAVKAMDESAHEVENGVQNTNKAGEALRAILAAAESVNQQAVQAAQAAEQMTSASADLVNSVETVAQSISQSTTATEKMARDSGEVTRAIENIASVSEENSASFEEVSASADEMKIQVEQVGQSASDLSEMADELQQVVKQFVLAQEEVIQPKKSAPVRKPAYQYN